MADEEVTVWLNTHRMEALEEQLTLQGSSVEKHLQDYLIDLYAEMVPYEEQQRIDAVLAEEAKAEKEAAEANRRFSVFRVIEHGERSLFLVDGDMDMLQTASRLRNYTKILESLRGYSKDMRMGNHFSDMFPKRQFITDPQFYDAVAERRDNTGRVVGAFQVDMDSSEFAALHIMDGWTTFRVKDICSAAYRAMRKDHLSWDDRWERFLSALDGKELTGTPIVPEVKGVRRLLPEEMEFRNEIIESDGKLNFYMPVIFDPLRVFGSKMIDVESINVYATYDPDRQCADTALEIVGFKSDAQDVRYGYLLTKDERMVLEQKMEAYCQQQYGQSLEEFSLEMLEEMSDPQFGSM